MDPTSGRLGVGGMPGEGMHLGFDALSRRWFQHALPDLGQPSMSCVGFHGPRGSCQESSDGEEQQEKAYDLPRGRETPVAGRGGSGLAGREAVV
jgi:hypothetical protein